jgi:hypothetical protein
MSRHSRNDRNKNVSSILKKEGENRRLERKGIKQSEG